LLGQTPEAAPAPASGAVPRQGQPQLLGPAQQPAQSPQPVKNADGTYTVRTNARLVVLDAVVTDKQGNVVTDLKREDFTVTELGEPETIRDFVASGAYALAPDVTIHSTAELDKLAPKAPVNIILLDEFNTRRLATDLVMAESSTMVYDAVPMTATEKSGAAGQYLIHVDETGVGWHIATDTEPRYAEVILLW
jgi:hypothetical protein